MPNRNIIYDYVFNSAYNLEIASLTLAMTGSRCHCEEKSMNDEVLHSGIIIEISRVFTEQRT